jgi:hypothetical protein
MILKGVLFRGEPASGRKERVTVGKGVNIIELR